MRTWSGLIVVGIGPRTCHIIGSGSIDRQLNGRHKLGPLHKTAKARGHNRDAKVVGHGLVVHRSKNNGGVLGSEVANGLHGQLGFFEL